MPGEDASQPVPGSVWPSRLAGFLALWAAGIALMLWVLPSVKPRSIWAASSDPSPNPHPSEFLYAMFPSSEDVLLWDTPGGRQTGTLKRAVANEQAEIDGGGWVRVIDVGSTNWVRVSDLKFLPPAGKADVLFAPLVIAFRAREPNEHRDASFTLTPASAGYHDAVLRLERDDNWDEYHYRVSANSAEPQAMFRQHGPAATFRQVLRWVCAVAIATPLAFLPLLVGMLRANAASRRTEPA